MTAAHGSTPDRGRERRAPRRIDRSDLGAGIVVAVVGLGFFLETLRIKRTGDVVGPETLPAIVGIGLMILGALLAVSAFRKHRATPDELMERSLAGSAGPSAVDTEADDRPAAQPAPVSTRVLLNFAVFFGYLFIFIPVGFLLSTAVFLFAMTCLYNRRRWVRNLIFSVVFSTVIYFAFKNGLGVYLPPGILG